MGLIQGIKQGSTRGDIKGDTSSLDYGSYAFSTRTRPNIDSNML